MKNNALHRFVLGLLQAHGCDRNAYMGQELESVAKELSDMEWEDERERAGVGRFGVRAVAEELISIGNAANAKEKKSKYLVVWDTDSCCDSFDAGNSLVAAKDMALDTLVEWMTQFSEQMDTSADAWDYMIYNCGVAVYRGDKELWHPDYKELERIGWVLVEDMGEEVYKAYADMYGWARM